jgi:hypothetical protein
VTYTEQIRATIAAKLDAGLARVVEIGECIEWQGKFACKGATPVVPFFNREKRRTDNASVPRLIWERDHGPIPAGKLVYRTCCNNACVRHLACGTRKDAMRARRKAGTTAHAPTTRITLTLAARRRANVSNSIEKARQVRQLAAASVKTDEIAQRTGVHPTMVAEIRQGRCWLEIAASPFQGLGA